MTDSARLRENAIHLRALCEQAGADSIVVTWAEHLVLRVSSLGAQVITPDETVELDLDGERYDLALGAAL